MVCITSSAALEALLVLVRSRAGPHPWQKKVAKLGRRCVLGGGCCVPNCLPAAYCLLIITTPRDLPLTLSSPWVPANSSLTDTHSGGYLYRATSITSTESLAGW